MIAAMYRQTRRGTYREWREVTCDGCGEALNLEPADAGAKDFCPTCAVYACPRCGEFDHVGIQHKFPPQGVCPGCLETEDREASL